MPEDQRLCYCDSGEVETELYVLFKCHKYSDLRESWLRKLTKPENFVDLLPNEKLNIILNKPENVKHTAKYLVSIMDLRRLLNKKY